MGECNGKNKVVDEGKTGNGRWAAASGLGGGGVRVLVWYLGGREVADQCWGSSWVEMVPISNASTDVPTAVAGNHGSVEPIAFVLCYLEQGPAAGTAREEQVGAQDIGAKEVVWVAIRGDGDWETEELDSLVGVNGDDSGLIGGQGDRDQAKCGEGSSQSSRGLTMLCSWW